MKSSSTSASSNTTPSRTASRRRQAPHPRPEPGLSREPAKVQRPEGGKGEEGATGQNYPSHRSPSTRTAKASPGKPPLPDTAHLNGRGSQAVLLRPTPHPHRLPLPDPRLGGVRGGLGPGRGQAGQGPNPDPAGRFSGEHTGQAIAAGRTDLKDTRGGKGRAWRGVPEAQTGGRRRPPGAGQRGGDRRRNATTGSSRTPGPGPGHHRERLRLGRTAARRPEPDGKTDAPGLQALQVAREKRDVAAGHPNGLRRGVLPEDFNGRGEGRRKIGEAMGRAAPAPTRPEDPPKGRGEGRRGRRRRRRRRSNRNPEASRTRHFLALAP